MFTLPGNPRERKACTTSGRPPSAVSISSAGGESNSIGHEVPSPEAARKFLYAFHEEEKIQEAKQRRLPDQIAYIPSESAALEGLGKVNQDLMQRFGERCPEQKIATVDQDTTIIESRKQEALHTYDALRMGRHEEPPKSAQARHCLWTGAGGVS